MGHTAGNRLGFWCGCQSKVRSGGLTSPRLPGPTGRTQEWPRATLTAWPCAGHRHGEAVRGGEGALGESLPLPPKCAGSLELL